MSFPELFSPLGKVIKLFGKFFGSSRDGAVLLDVAQDKFFKLHRVYVNDLGVAKLQIKMLCYIMFPDFDQGYFRVNFNHFYGERCF